MLLLKNKIKRSIRMDCIKLFLYLQEGNIKIANFLSIYNKYGIRRKVKWKIYLIYLYMYHGAGKTDPRRGKILKLIFLWSTAYD